MTNPQTPSAQSPHFCDAAHVRALIEGKRIALVGSGPGVLANPRGFVDSHDVVVRVNNYKVQPNSGTGERTDVFFSYFGTAIKKSASQLQADGVQLCINKCPDDQFIESEWHRRNHKMHGVDFRYIYDHRREWWFCPTYVPTTEEFMAQFLLLDGHVPTTGFSALLFLLQFKPSNIFLTGYDFFLSKIHNVNEPWRKLNHSDPIGHVPMAERDWFKKNVETLPVTMDAQLSKSLSDSYASQFPGLRQNVQMERKRRGQVLRSRLRATV